MFFSICKQLYELDNDPQRKEFLDDLFVFMQKRGKIQRWSLLLLKIFVLFFCEQLRKLL